MSAAAATSRKRRAVAATSGTDAISNGFDTYHIQGDAKGALTILQQQRQDSEDAPSVAGTYNEQLLTLLCACDASVDRGAEEERNLVQRLQALELDVAPSPQEDSSSSASSSSSSSSSRKRRRNQLIGSYNRALLLHAQGDSETAAHLCQETLQSYRNNPARPPDELVPVVTRTALLLLECHWALGRHTTHEAAALLAWLEMVESDKDDELKFLLHLYRSRGNLSELNEAGKHCDHKIRAARKELKQAMDLLQNKLRTSFGAETGSVVSSATSEENHSNQSAARDTHQTQHDSLIPHGSIVLQRHCQSALSLKANTERLKGNTKKSLVLCGEAHAAALPDPSYEAIHANNLAIIFETNGKRHLALHALAKGLGNARRHGSNPSSADIHLHADGTARPDHTLAMMHNAAICALQAGHYRTAYECMATCLAQSPRYSQQPRSWVRLAEACVGLYVSLSQQEDQRPRHWEALMANDEPRGVLVNTDFLVEQPDVSDEVVVSVLASPEDMAQVARNPLVRARATLERILRWDPPVGEDILVPAQLMLAYVKLAFRDYEGVLGLCGNILDHPTPVGNDQVLIRTHRQIHASARIYAAEACLALGNANDAMKFMVGETQQDGALDHLAFELCGVDQKMAAADADHKIRYALSQATVKANASSITAALGNHSVAKQLALAAQTMEDAVASHRECSHARRALAYASLMSGNHGSTIPLLKSLR